jgi:hypothetical protein
MKSAIIERLGQAELLLPSLIAEGLDANERVKLRLSTLQAAARHAREPRAARFDLAAETRAAGIDPIAYVMKLALGLLIHWTRRATARIVTNT